MSMFSQACSYFSCAQKCYPDRLGGCPVFVRDFQILGSAASGPPVQKHSSLIPALSTRLKCSVNWMTN